MPGTIDNNVINSWKGKVNSSLNGEKLHSKTTGKAWTNGLFGCFSPIDLCALTCCLPCVTFGKTHHRLEHNGDMTHYEPINTSCILFYLSSFVCATPILSAIQTSELRERHNLEGSCISDLLKSCCCGCCQLIQTEKEAKLLLGGEKGVVQQQYQGGAGPDGGMVYPGQGQPAGAPQ